MKMISVRCFFKSRNYRKKCVQYIKAKIFFWIKLPFIYIKAIYDVFKLYHDYPNKWERYVKRKEIEKDTEITKIKTAQAIAFSHFIGAIYRFENSLLTYATVDLSNSDYETLRAEFKQAKEEFTKYASELEKLDVFVSDKLKVMVNETNINRFADCKECKIFCDEINAVIDTMKSNL